MGIFNSVCLVCRVSCVRQYECVSRRWRWCCCCWPVHCRRRRDTGHRRRAGQNGHHVIQDDAGSARLRALPHGHEHPRSAVGSAGASLVFRPPGQGHGARCRRDRARRVQRDDRFPGLPRLRVFDGAFPRRQSRADGAQERPEMGKVRSAHDRKAAKACHEAPVELVCRWVVAQSY